MWIGDPEIRCPRTNPRQDPNVGRLHMEVVETVGVGVDGTDEVGAHGKDAEVRSCAQNDYASCSDSNSEAYTGEIALHDSVTIYLRDNYNYAHHVFASSYQKVQTDGLEDAVGHRPDDSTSAYSGTWDHGAVVAAEGVLALLDRSMREDLVLSSPEAVASYHPKEERGKADLGEEWERNRALVSRSSDCTRLGTLREMLERLAPLEDHTCHNSQTELKDLGEDDR